MQSLSFFKHLAKVNRTRLKKPKLPKQPRHLEREYQRTLRFMVSRLHELVRNNLLPKLPHLYSQAITHVPVTARQDAWADDFSEIIKVIRYQFGQEFSEDEIKDMANRAGVTIADFNQRAVKEQISNALGVDVFFSEPWLAGSLEAFTLNNYNLITSLVDRDIGKVNQAVIQGFRDGQRWEDISDTILENFDVTENQADLIARDQVNKLNGEMTRLRQTSVGVDKYIWSTVGDERVRDSHRENEGKTFSWDNPPSETGHPGEDINCRCIAMPVLDGEPDQE